MNLTNLEAGEIGFIKNINLDENLKNKLVEMGFIKDEKIQVLNISPFKNSMIVKIMDYKLSLSFDEAKNIEITKNKINNTENEIKIDKKDNVEFKKLKKYLNFADKCFMCCNNCTNNNCKNGFSNATEIKFAIVGNPNCGKTTLFNLLTHKNESTGNYSGVTIDVKSATFYFDNCKIHIYDLPGVYSLNGYYNEEKITIDFLKNEQIDLIINVLDSTKLKRSLFLTTELKENFNFILCAFNLYDEFKLNGYSIDLDKFEDNFEIFVEPTITKNGTGINNLIKKGIAITRYIKINNIINRR